MTARIHLATGALLAAGALLAPPSGAQETRAARPASDGLPAPFTALRWRNVGPNRGGRSIAAAGSAARPFEYYFGATGGGLWKTTDGGTTWRSVTDGQIRSSSVGAVAVAPSDPDVVYIGMGEAELRANVIQGDGIYRSTDGGRTWTHAGLAPTRTISRIRVHPADPDIAYAAALGDPYAHNEERGVYRTTDGGRSWKRVLHRNDRTGAADLVIDPADPRVLYASLWEVHRKPWLLSSGGAGSGLFKSTDGGETWNELTRNPGLPAGTIGKVTIAVSPADPRRVWANVEAGDGGLYRSDDGGATWAKVNGSRDLWQRSFYFMRMTADPRDPETIYVLNFDLLKSTDGGRSFRVVRTRHPDYHDLWIAPDDPRRMIVADDGGASVSVNGGEAWTEQRYPTAQIYRVTTTGDFPYHICGAQQDNTTVCVASHGASTLRIPGRPSGEAFYDVGGGEDAYIANDPRDPNVFFAGATNTLTRYDRRTGDARDVQPEPRLVMGEPASAMRERWNWVYPIVFSPADSTTLYAGSQHLWRTRDGGATWSRVSPDLTRADPATLGNSGGPIVLDQDGPEVYATLFSIAPSPRAAATIWTGSDDGLVHVTRDGGTRWADVTPKELPPHSRISLVEASPHDAATAYVAARRHEMGDRTPYVFRTRDHGRTWTRIVRGIADGDYAHSIREDPVRRGLLYLGTEHGVYVSFDDGEAWHPLRLDLPDVEVTSLTVTDRDVVIATHGRSFYVLDDVTPLRQWRPEAAARDVHLFRPADAVRRVYAADIDFVLRAPAERVTIEILDAGGRLVRRLPELANVAAGSHRTTWDGRTTGATSFPGIVLEGGDPTRGPWAPPGQYTVRLVVGTHTLTQPLRVRRDPRLRGVTDADLRRQYALAVRIRDAESTANEAVLRIRATRARVEARVGESGASRASLATAARPLLEQLGAIEGELYQVRNRSPKDKIAFPIKLNDRLTGLRSNLEQGDGPPTAAYTRVFGELSAELEALLARLRKVEREELARFEARVATTGRPLPDIPSR